MPLVIGTIPIMLFLVAIVVAPLFWLAQHHDPSLEDEEVTPVVDAAISPEVPAPVAVVAPAAVVAPTAIGVGAALES
jgi:hypothetical protein